MKAACTSLLVTLLLTACLGCLRLEEVLTIRADGSGTLEMEYVIPESTLAQLKAMQRLRKRLATVEGDRKTVEEPDDEYTRFLLYYGSEDIEKKFKQYEKHGIRLERIKVESRDARRHVELKARFRNITQLQDTAMFPEHGFTLERQSDGNYFFRRRPLIGTGEPTPRPSEKEVRTLTPILRGFYVTVQINTPGRIIRTNAPRRSLYRAEWSFDFAQDPNAFTDFQNQEFRIAFEGRGLSLPQLKDTADNE